MKKRIFPPEYKTVDKGHGRIEIRIAKTSTMLNEYIKFPHVKQILKVNRIRMDLKGNNRTEETAYYITSLGEEKADAKELLKLVRGHWSIESLHWIRDRVFDEDRSQTRRGSAPRAFATLLKINSMHHIASSTRKIGRKTERALALICV